MKKAQMEDFQSGLFFN